MQRRMVVLTASILVVVGMMVLWSATGRAAERAGVAGAQSPESVGTLQAQVAEKFAATGRQHLGAGRYKEAIQDFTLALGYDPSLKSAQEGLEQAKVRMQSAPAARSAAEASAKPLPAGVAMAPSAPATGKTGPAEAEPAEKKADIDAECDAAMQQSMREIGRMRVPQTEIMVKTSSPEKRPDLRRRKDQSSEVISTAGMDVDDEEVSNEIRAKLLKKVSVNFDGQSFEEAIQYIRVASDVNIVVDRLVVPDTTPVHLTVSNMQLQGVLGYILKFQKLDYRIWQGAIFVSSSAGLAERPLIVMYDMSDLIAKVKDFDSRMVQVMSVPDYGRGPARGTGEQPQDEVLERTLQGEEWVEFIRRNIAPGTWGGEGQVGQNTIAYRNGKLVVTQSPDVQEQIRGLLDSFRKARAIQVAILARFIEINEDFLEDLGISWSGLGAGGAFGIIHTTGDNTFQAGITPSTEVGLTSGFTDAIGGTFEFQFLDGWQVNTILTAVKKEKKGNVLTAPRVTCFNTQRAFLTVSTRRNFVRSYDSNGQPEIGQVNDGIVLEVQPFVSADRRYITLEIIPQVNQVAAMQEFTTSNVVIPDPLNPGNLIATEQVVQLPSVTTRQVMTTVSVPDGGTLMVGGLAQAAEAEGWATVPILGDLPLIKYLFTSHRKLDARNNLIVLVTAHIIQQQED